MKTNFMNMLLLSCVTSMLHIQNSCAKIRVQASIVHHPFMQWHVSPNENISCTVQDGRKFFFESEASLQLESRLYKIRENKKESYDYDINIQ
ncbi:MAG: hypothetical protein FJ161_03595 [Gammaproteobacteria bacterium]|nr:hypothetical protein [Gammaproteobacteria bacterium]